MGPKGPGSRSLDSNGHKMAKFTRVAVLMLLHSQGTSVAVANLRSAMAGGWRIQYQNTEAEGGETSTQTTYSGLAADQIHTSYHDIGFELKKV